MNDNFYDFDKDDAFDESYLKKSSAPPKKKEFEIDIPVPESGIKSTIPKKNQNEKVKPESAKRKKLSPTALTLTIIGIVFSCFIVYVFGFLGTIFGWSYLPDLDKQASENSVVDDAAQIQEVVEISDDGTSVEVVPLYKDTGNSNQPSSSSKDDSDEKASSDATEDTDAESSGTDDVEPDDSETATDNIDSPTENSESDTSSNEEVIYEI